MYSFAEYIEELEIKNYIQQFQNLTPAQLEKMLLEETHFRPSQEQNHCLQKAFLELLEQADPAPRKIPAWRSLHSREDTVRNKSGGPDRISG